MTSTLVDHRPPPVRIRRSAEQWQSLLEQYERSGLSQAAFCQQEGLAIATFSKWLARSRHSELNPTKPAASTPAPFVEVQRSPAEQAPLAPPDSPVMIRLDLGAGIVLEVSRA